MYFAGRVCLLPGFCRYKRASVGRTATFEYAIKMCIRDSSASVQYNDVKGVMKGSDRKTFNGNVDLVYEFGSLLFRNSLEVGLSEANESPYGSFDQYVKLNPYWTGKDKKGEVMKELEETNDLFNPGPVDVYKRQALWCCQNEDKVIRPDVQVGNFTDERDQITYRCVTIGNQVDVYKRQVDDLGIRRCDNLSGE